MISFAFPTIFSFFFFFFRNIWRKVNNIIREMAIKATISHWLFWFKNYWILFVSLKWFFDFYFITSYMDALLKSSKNVASAANYHLKNLLSSICKQIELFQAIFIQFVMHALLFKQFEIFEVTTGFALVIAKKEMAHNKQLID